MNRLTTISFVAVIALAAILLTSSMAHVSPVVAKKSGSTSIKVAAVEVAVAAVEVAVEQWK